MSTRPDPATLFFTNVKIRYNDTEFMFNPVNRMCFYEGKICTFNDLIFHIHDIDHVHDLITHKDEFGIFFISLNGIEIRPDDFEIVSENNDHFITDGNPHKLVKNEIIFLKIGWDYDIIVVNYDTIYTNYIFQYGLCDLFAKCLINKLPDKKLISLYIKEIDHVVCVDSNDVIYDINGVNTIKISY